MMPSSVFVISITDKNETKLHSTYYPTAQQALQSAYHMAKYASGPGGQVTTNKQPYEVSIDSLGVTYKVVELFDSSGEFSVDRIV